MGRKQTEAQPKDNRDKWKSKTRDFFAKNGMNK
jgi:hypothetical protein